MMLLRPTRRPPELVDSGVADGDGESDTVLEAWMMVDGTPPDDAGELSVLETVGWTVALGAAPLEAADWVESDTLDVTSSAVDGVVNWLLDAAVG